MNPIPTTNAMKPAPGKGVSSFPTPVIKDTVIVEIVNAWKGDYQPLEYGTKWDDVPHASVQGSYPDHKLINQSPNSEDGQWVKRIWANDRVDQDTYNYAIKYSGGSDAHPIYIRTYVELRETYAPVPDLSPDPLFPNAKLVEEEVQREDGELDSRYVKVIRTYETLPGPIISSQRVNERGDLETVEVQEVAPSTSPDPDGLLVTQTQVLKEDVSKGTKTTATVPSHSQLLIKEKKEGLLGETVTTDDIVDPATNPDALTQSIVASVVQQTSATKAVKRTTTASGPASLSKQSKDGKLLGDVTSTQSVVAPNASPDAVSSTILSSEVSQVDSGKAIKTNTILNSTPTLLGKQAGEGLLGTRETIEVIVLSGASADVVSETIISSQIEPIDSVRSRKVTTTSSGPKSLSGAQKGEGLLGETTIEESIVAAGEEPDGLDERIVSSKVDPIDLAKSKKTTITSNGPKSLSGNRINQRGDTETIEESIVPSGTIAGPDDFLLISSEIQPIDAAKSRLTKTTVESYSQLSGLDKKPGLLGQTQTIETIVDPSTQPENLTFDGSGGIIESSVSPISATKSKKTTVTSSGPALLSVRSLTDSPLGLVVADVEQTIVQPSQSPENGLTVISDSIQSIDSVKSRRERVTVDSWPINYGRTFEQEFATGFLYEETIVTMDEAKNALDELNFTEYKILDNNKVLKRTYDSRQIRSVLNSQYYITDTAVNIKLPDTLDSVTVYWGRSGGAGGSGGTGQSIGTGTYSSSTDSSTKSSSSISGDVYFAITNGFDGNITGKMHEFFLQIGSDGEITSQAILSKLQGGPYSEWPVIRTKTDNIVLITGSKSLSEAISRSRSVNINGATLEESANKQFDVNVGASSIVVPNCLRGSIGINETTIGSFASDVEPTYGVRPSNLTATTPSKFPTGKYLYSSNVELYKWGFAKVRTITVEITAQHV